MSISKTNEKSQIGTEPPEKKIHPKSRVPKSARPKPEMKQKGKSKDATDWSTTYSNSSSSSTSTSTALPQQQRSSDTNLVNRSDQSHLPTGTAAPAIQINFDYRFNFSTYEQMNLNAEAIALDLQLKEDIKDMQRHTPDDNRTVQKKNIDLFIAKAQAFMSGTNKFGSAPLHCVNLVAVSPMADDEGLKDIFNVAKEYRLKGFDVPSLIVNDALGKGNFGLIMRMRLLFPEINLASGLHKVLESWQTLVDDKNQLTVVKMMLADGGTPEYVHERSLLEVVACQTGDVELMGLLLDKGISSPSVNSGYFGFELSPLLHGVAACGHLSLLKFMVERGYDFAQTLDGDKTVLMDACNKKGNLEMVKYLVENCLGSNLVSKKDSLKKAMDGMSDPIDYEIKRFLLESLLKMAS